MTDRLGRITKGEHLSRNTEFKPGHEIGKATRFKKGHANGKKASKVGTEMLSGGKLYVKMPGGKWRLKKQAVYEKHNGKIARDEIIVFLDKDNFNFDISNLYKLNKKEFGLIQLNRLLTTDRELTMLGIMWVKLIRKIKEVEDEQSKVS